MKANIVNMQFYALLFAVPLVIGNSISSDIRQRDAEETGIPDAHEIAYPKLDSHAVSPEDIPKRFHGYIELMDVDSDGDFESFYVWKNPDGRNVRLPLIKNGNSMAFPTVSKRSLTPIEIPRGLEKSTYFMDIDMDGDNDAVLIEYGSNGAVVFPLTKKGDEPPRTYMI
ncbi:MAG: hypothetical protein JW789_00540 [Candidatus Aenigmarchaeota archaeon]|nr:hypothetical protein [Candidatus Aenigmarchaeota archaeon]